MLGLEAERFRNDSASFGPTRKLMMVWPSSLYFLFELRDEMLSERARTHRNGYK